MDWERQVSKKILLSACMKGLVCTLQERNCLSPHASLVVGIVCLSTLLDGVKASIMLEELVELNPDFEYDAFTINIMEGDQFTSGFVAVNPNSKIPAIYDKSNGARVFESGAVLWYLAEKYGTLLPTDPVTKAECMSWVFFQVGSGPYYGGGGLHHFKNSAPMQW